MDDILSQIIAYAPDRIDTETKARALVQGPRNMYNQGQLVQPNADGSRPGYSGKLKLSEVKKLRADGKTTDQIIKKLKVSKGIYEAFVTANKDKLPYVAPNKISKERLKFLNEEAVKLGYKDFASVPKTEQKQPGVRGYGPRENILTRATRREKGVPEGKGSPGVKRTIAPDRSGLYTEEARAKQLQSQKNTYQATPKGERLQWIADNGKNYDNPKDFIKAYEKHFKHKIGSKADVLFNKDGRVAIGLIDNLTNLSGEPTKAMSDIFSFKKGFSEEEIFKASIIQNNPKVQKQFKNLFNDIHNNVSLYSELGPEGVVERLKSKGGNLLEDFDFIKSYSAGGQQTYGGVHRGITRNSLRFLGIPEEHIASYQNVRQPLMALSQIIQNLKNPSFAKDFGISPSTAKKISGQLENFLKGEGGLRKDITKINSQLGDVKFNNIFGGVNFEHTLAKQFGKDYRYLPRNYLLKGQFTSKAFNMMKRDAFDLPLIKLMKQYEQGKIPAERVQAFIDDFNSKTNNYADFKFDVDKEKLGYTSDSVTYDLSRYNDPNVARQELIDNIKLTQSDTFQKGMKNTVGSGNQLKLFKSKEAKEILSKLEKLGCGKSAGGRIMFGEGTTCAIKGREAIEKGLKNGFKNADEASLARGILKSGKFLKDAVSLRGLFGPAALAFTVAAEAGIVGYDMLSGGKSFREAVGDSVFNYMLGDKTKINSEEEFIKRLKNVPGSPGQGFRGFTDDDINKMLVFKSKLDDMQTGFSNYSDLLDINKKIEENTERQNIGSGFFPDEAFQLEAKKDKIQADIRDYNKVGTPRNVTDYMISDEGVKGGDALARGTLLAKESQLLDAYRSSPKGIENLKKDLIDTRFNLEQMFNPTKYDENAKYFMGLPKSEQSKLMSYENMLDPFREKFMSKPKSEQSRIMSYGYKEGGIASLNVKK